jgi:hypothetical protein
LIDIADPKVRERERRESRISMGQETVQRKEDGIRKDISIISTKISKESNIPV